MPAMGEQGDVYMAAIDLGASNGRVILGTLRGGSRLEMREAYRWVNCAVREEEGEGEEEEEEGEKERKRTSRLCWDIAGLWCEACKGLGIAARIVSEETGDTSWISSVGVDAWGLDYVLLRRDHSIAPHSGCPWVRNPASYRDSRTQGLSSEVIRTAGGREQLFALTGAQSLEWNTLFQLVAEVQDSAKAGQDAFKETAGLLLIAGALHYRLCGESACEFTEATPTQCYSPRTHGWAVGLLERFGVPARVLPRIVLPGTVLGRVHADLWQSELGCVGPPPLCIAPAAHDTASAVAAVPALSIEVAEGEWAFLSCGTWCMMGVEVTDPPACTPEVLRAGFGYEGSVAGRWQLLRNIPGLWLVQETVRCWHQKPGYEAELAALRGTGGSSDWEAAMLLADSAAALAGGWVDPDNARFRAPDNMPDAVHDFCRATQQAVPSSPAALLRCIFESLALKFRAVLELLCTIQGRTPPRCLFVVGGGAANTLLCRMIADATGIPVQAGPVEATAAGNLGMQAVGLGVLRDAAAVRACIARSFPQTPRYHPGGTVGMWARAAEHWKAACSKV